MGNTINDLFEEQVEKTPDNIAIVYSKKELTYRELNKKVNMLVNYLKDEQVQRDDFIGIILDHSEEMIISILAAVKLGATYIPMEPDFSKKRINYILEQTKAKLVITSRKYKNIIDKERKTIYYDETVFQEYPKEDPKNENNPSTALYVLYTSGTTGKPKGVIIEHRNVCNYVKAFKEYFKITPEDRMLQSSVCTFDIFTEELYPILLTGGALVIADKEKTKKSEELLNFIGENNITITSTFPYFLNEVDKLEIPKSWRIAISGGDVLRKEYIKHISKKLDVYNTYGPTETTVCASYYKYDENYKLSNSIPVGKPIKGVEIYVLNDKLEKVKNGQVGELCITGNGVSRGYVDKKEKSNSNFIVNPYNSKQKMYKSGDLGRILEDGNIEFIKRKDQQVMIYGKRVEPLEVENVLLKINKIDNAIVKPYEDSNGLSYLAAYYIVDKGENENINQVKEEMRDYLPEFMIPEFFVKMESFPLTPNGKLDRKCLPIVMK